MPLQIAGTNQPQRQVNPLQVPQTPQQPGLTEQLVSSAAGPLAQAGLDKAASGAFGGALGGLGGALGGIASGDPAEAAKGVGTEIAGQAAGAALCFSGRQ